MAVYLDASVLRGSIRGPEMASVRAVAKAVGQDLVIPSVALAEATANRRRSFELVIQKVRDAIEEARVHFPLGELSFPDASLLALQWEQQWTAAATVIGLKPENAAEGLRREIERVRPARESNRRASEAATRPSGFPLLMTTSPERRRATSYPQM
jgi:hypothetical protein